MSDLETAAQRLRDSVAALPNWARQWQARGAIVESAGAWPIAEVRDLSRSDRAETTDAVAEHIATAASPPTVTLLADLLDAFAAGELIAASRSVHDLVDALASAILHTDIGERS